MLTDPAFLRYIVDGLDSKSIQQENIAALPSGLIGIYEEALHWKQNMQERGRFLQFFSFWALLKKEVSPTLVSSLLNWPAQEVIDNLYTYAKWFNSPTSGTFILYNERLRTYLLSKITSDQLNQTNQKIIKSCQHALELNKGDEWEIYALEHLPSHMLIPAMQENEDGDKFKKLVYDTNFWNRQLEISKEFDWSKKMLNLALGWAANQNIEELIECALYKIDLHYMEQNDAPRIVELVAQNDIETALQRIESFGGNDKEGLKRKFILYMLCFMELTLLESKDKPFRKSAIEKLLNYLDENIPVDHSLLKWNDFFPSYLMFLMACEWAEFGLNFMIINRRTDKWDIEWLADNGPYSGVQFNVLKEFAQVVNDPYKKDSTLVVISTQLTKQGKIDEALSLARGISDDYTKNETFNFISTELAKQGKIEDAFYLAQAISDDSNKNSALSCISSKLAQKGKIEEALSCARYINTEIYQSQALQDITTEMVKLGNIEEAITFARGLNSYICKFNVFEAIYIELAKQGKLQEATSVMEEARSCAMNISNEMWKDAAIVAISTFLTKLERLEEALSFIRNISDDYRKNLSFTSISIVLTKLGKIEEAFSCTRNISDESEMSNALSNISTELTLQGKIDQAILCARSISDTYWKKCAFKNISIQLTKQGNLEDAISCIRNNIVGNDMIRLLTSISIELAQAKKLNEATAVLEEAIYYSQSMNNDFIDFIKEEISLELTKLGKIERALECARRISKEGFINYALMKMCPELILHGRTKEAASVIEEALLSHSGLNKSLKMKNTLEEISIKLAKKGKIEEVLTFVRGISNKSDISSVLSKVSIEFMKQGYKEEALFCTSSINDPYYKSSTLLAISTELIKQGNINDSDSVIEEAYSCARVISDKNDMISQLCKISAELINQKNMKESLSVLTEATNCARDISDETDMISQICKISTELAKQGKVEESSYLIEEAISNSLSMNVEWNKKNYALCNISTELAKQGKIEKALYYVRDVSDLGDKISALVKISSVLAEQKKTEEATSVIEEALFYFRNKSDDSVKGNALENISELADQGEIEESLEEAFSFMFDNLIGDFQEKNFIELSTELAIQGKIEEALSCARDINDESSKCSALINISTELSRLGNFNLAEKIGLEIPLISSRHECWKKIASQQKEQFGWEVAFKNIYKFYSEEAQNFQFKGWAESLTVDDISDELTHLAIQALQNDYTSLEYFLQVYAQYELFFGNPSKEKIDRLHKTLNLQWALDIIKQFHKESEYNSTEN